jgi:hypothetical protein
MFKTKIAGAAAALALLAAPSVAAAHDGHHHDRGHHHKHKHQVREVTGTATATVASFDGKDLTLTLPSGRAFTAGVSDKTTIFCFTAAPQAAASHHGNGDDDGPGHDAGDDHGTNHDAGDDNGQGDVNGNGRCGTDALTAGAKVRFAKLSLAGGDALWKKVVIVK